jgi:thymidylate synthase
MALLLKGYDIGEVWHDLVKHLYMIGRNTAPREQDTREILNVTIEVWDGLKNILVHENRDLNYKFMVAEWLWILSGSNGVESIAKYNSVLKNFSDDGSIFNGAYGPKLIDQWEYVIRCLEKADTRQAVATIWERSPHPSKDVPCTISLQWFIRDGLMFCTVNMRSSDVWLGFPYDFFNFSQLTNCLASYFGIGVGSITMNLGSSHLYERDVEKAIKVIQNVNSDYVASPLLTRSKLMPPMPPESFMSILLKPDLLLAENLVTNEWHGYARVLAAKSKAEALEVLREL